MALADSEATLVDESPTGPPVEDEVGASLVQAAIEVFAEKGYDRAGVQEIARRAGLTTGAIYNRYAGKADLLKEAIHRSSRDELEKLFAEHGYEGHATDIVRRVGSHLASRPVDAGEALLFEAIAAARRDPEVADVVRAHLADRADRFSKVIEAAKADGSLDPSFDTDTVVRFSHTVALGFMLFDTLGVERPDPDKWTDFISRLLAALASTPQQT